MHVQYSNGVAIWQHVLKWVVNTSNVLSNIVNINDVLRADRKQFFS